MASPIFSDDLKLQPYWWEAAPRPKLPPAELPGRADVAIVGSGFSGLSAALTLARAGRSVVVFEAGDPGFGASSRNGGMCGGAFKIAFSDLSARLGVERAVAIYNDGQAALDYLAQLIEREQIHCHFARMGRFVGAHAPSHYESMARETELLRKHVRLEADMVPRSEQRAEIGSDIYHGGRLIHRDGGLHPALYHQGLLERATAAGAAIAANAPVTGIRGGNGGFTVTSDRGRITARDVIVATNGYTGRTTPWLRRRLVPVGSFMIATEPLGAEVMGRLLPKGRMLADSKKILYYFRPSPDGRRILFGGRTAYGTTSEDLRATGATLHRFMTGVFPELAGAQITHSWSGNVAFTFDRMPHGGVHDGIHYAIGYCGSGVVKATWFGHQTARRILGQAVETPLFDADFPTLPLYGGTPWFLPLVSMYYQLQDRFAR
ncbi:MAG: NAD(P)/FAD-dependent oxidoreductase [Alphaproteobacteria bacterium]